MSKYLIFSPDVFIYFFNSSLEDNILIEIIEKRVLKYQLLNNIELYVLTDIHTYIKKQKLIA